MVNCKHYTVRLEDITVKMSLTFMLYLCYDDSF